MYPCVIPTIVKDYNRLRTNYRRIFDCLPVSKMIFIGPEALKAVVEEDSKNKVFGDHEVSFMYEGDIMSLDDLRPLFNSLITPENNLKPTAVNWYYQQFLKMGYARHCDAEYYLCWDSDTVPLRKIELFSADGKPYLDVKNEYNNTYFITIERLFGFSKIIQKSFISEHMFFNVALMKEMLDEIDRTSYEGDNFGQKIINAVGSDNLNQGFSEFETFGSWVGMRHSSAYKLRDWRSFRNTNFFMDISELTQEDIDWLAKDYDAATFEKYQETNEVLNQLFKDPRYREKLSPKQFYTTILESGVFGEYANGSIIGEDFNAPS